MATYSFRTDERDEKNLDLLQKEHRNYKVRRNTILRASLEAFKSMSIEERNNFLVEILSRDSRKCHRYG